MRRTKLSVTGMVELALCVLIIFTVVEAKALLGKDKNGKSDPYAVVYCGSKKKKTKVKKKSLNPVWDETFVL